jgi:hypothetical protein
MALVQSSQCCEIVGACLTIVNGSRSAPITQRLKVCPKCNLIIWRHFGGGKDTNFLRVIPSLELATDSVR